MNSGMVSERAMDGFGMIIAVAPGMMLKNSTQGFSFPAIFPQPYGASGN